MFSILFRHKPIWEGLLLFFLPMLAHAQQALLVPFRQGDLWGFSDEKRHLVIAPVYDEVGFFRDSILACCHLSVSYAVVSRGDSSWLIGSDGKRLTPGFLRDPYLDLRYFDDGLLYFNTHSGAFVLDRSLRPKSFYAGMQISSYPHVGLERGEDTDMEWVMISSNGIWPIDRLCGANFTQSPSLLNSVDFGKNHFVSDLKNTVHGLIGPTGRTLIKAQYHELGNLWRGSVVADGVIMDAGGKVLARSSYHLYPRISESGLIRVLDTLTQRIGFVDTRGRTVLAPQYLRAYGFYRDLAFCQQADSTWVLINPRGQTVLKVFPDARQAKKRFVHVGGCREVVRIDQGLVWSDQCLFVRQADQFWHGYDWKLHELTTLPLDMPPLQVNWRGIKGYLGIRDGLTVFFDNNWKLILEPLYESIEDAHKHWWEALSKDDHNSAPKVLVGVKNEKKILLDQYFNPIGEADTERGDPRFDAYGFIFRKNGQFGVVDTAGRVSVPPIYDHLHRCSDPASSFAGLGVFWAGNKGRYGVLRADGSVAVPLVFKDIAHGWRYHAGCDPFNINCYVDSLQGKWHFLNTLGVYRAFPDSVVSIAGEMLGNWTLVAHTARHKYVIGYYDGALKPLTASKWPDDLLLLERTLDRLRDSLDRVPHSPGVKITIDPAGRNLIYVTKSTKEGSHNEGAILDAGGKVLLGSIQDLGCEGGALNYRKDGVRCQWNVPTMSQHKIDWRDYDHRLKDGCFIKGGAACSPNDSVKHSDGLFQGDGTCLVPARCGQHIAYDYNTGMYHVWRDRQETLFDGINGVFRTEASRYLPYRNAEHANNGTPRGYFWIDIDHKPGLVRILDGMTFFEE